MAGSVPVIIELPNGTTMPSMGFGTWQLTPDEQAEHASLAALQAGYRHIDTAKIYGNETGVGRAIAASGIARRELYVTTKLWNDDHAPAAARAALDGSLQRLGLDYVDLYLVHWPGSDVLDGSWQAMQELYAAGKTKAIGVSNYGIRQLQTLLQSGGQTPMVNQIELHPYIWADQRELVDYCQQQGIIVEAYSPIKRLNREGQEAVNLIAAVHGRSPSQVVLRWCLQHGTVPLPRSSDTDHIRENIDVFDFELTEDEMGIIDTLGQ